MEPEVLQERLTKLFDQNEPENTMETMPRDLKDAFNSFAMSYAKKWAPGNKMLPVIAVSAGSFAQGFWLGHDYALEHGQLRGN